MPLKQLIEYVNNGATSLRLSTLENIDFRNQPLIEKLIVAIQQNKKLKTLNLFLKKDAYGVEGQETITSHQLILLLVRILNLDTNIHVLNISNYELSLWAYDLNQNMQNHLLQGLTNNQSLQEISLVRLSATNDFSKKLFKVLETKSSLKSLTIDNIVPSYEEYSDELKHISYKANSFCPIDMRGLTCLLHNNPSLKSLSLIRVGINDKGMRRLAREIQWNTALTSLRLTHNKINNKGAIYLSNALRINRTIDLLDLSDNDIAHSGLTGFATVLRENTSLQALFLSGNNFHGADLRAFCDALKQNKTLKHLYLDNNQFGRLGMIDLIDALPENTSLITVWLQKTDIHMSLLKRLFTKIKHNTTLRRLNLSYCDQIDIFLDQEMLALLAANYTLTDLSLKKQSFSEKQVEINTILSRNKDIKQQLESLFKSFEKTRSCAYEEVRDAYEKLLLHEPNLKQLEEDSYPVELSQLLWALPEAHEKSEQIERLQILLQPFKNPNLEHFANCILMNELVSNAIWYSQENLNVARCFFAINYNLGKNQDYKVMRITTISKLFNMAAEYDEIMSFMSDKLTLGQEYILRMVNEALLFSKQRDIQNPSEVLFLKWILAHHHKNLIELIPYLLQFRIFVDVLRKKFPDDKALILLNSVTLEYTLLPMPELEIELASIGEADIQNCKNLLEACHDFPSKIQRLRNAKALLQSAISLLEEDKEEKVEENNIIEIFELSDNDEPVIINSEIVEETPIIAFQEKEVEVLPNKNDEAETIEIESLGGFSSNIEQDENMSSELQKLILDIQGGACSVDLSKLRNGDFYQVSLIGELIQVVKESTTLKTLIISPSNENAQIFQLIRVFLSSVTTLRVIEISDGHLNPFAIAHFLEGLKNNKSLQKISLGELSFDGLGSSSTQFNKDLLEVLSSNKFLRSLINNSADEDEMIEMEFVKEFSPNVELNEYQDEMLINVEESDPVLSRDKALKKLINEIVAKETWSKRKRVSFIETRNKPTGIRELTKKLNQVSLTEEAALEAVIKKAKKKHSRFFVQPLQWFFRGRHEDTNELYRLLGNLNLNDEKTIDDLEDFNKHWDSGLKIK